jgi:hypothetical protein
LTVPGPAHILGWCLKLKVMQEQEGFSGGKNGGTEAQEVSVARRYQAGELGYATASKVGMPAVSFP